MKERPILFNGDMVRAILGGRKTQSRRIIKSPAKNMQKQGATVIRRNPDNDPWYKDHIWSMRTQSGMWGDYTHERFLQFCPHGQVGDRLWVRENFRGPRAYVLNQYKPKDWGNKPVWFCADGRPRAAHQNNWHDRVFPSIHMPRHLSRMTLEITGVRVERLQNISEEDAIAEGCQALEGCKWRTFKEMHAGIPMHEHTAVDAFGALWENINGPGSWDANPWVWVIEFKVVA